MYYKTSNSSKRIAQLRAISCAKSKKAKARREAFILGKEGTLELFTHSVYKTLRGYIRHFYGVSID